MSSKDRHLWKQSQIFNLLTMTKAYKIILSNNISIAIDEDEVSKAIECISTGSVGKMRQGIFNPSFLVAIVLDQERLKEYHEKNPTYNFGEQIEVKPIGNLPDIFSEHLIGKNVELLK